MLKLRTVWHALRRQLVGATKTSRVMAQGMVEYGILVALIAVAVSALSRRWAAGLPPSLDACSFTFRGWANGSRQSGIGQGSRHV